MIFSRIFRSLFSCLNQTNIFEAQAVESANIYSRCGKESRKKAGFLDATIVHHRDFLDTLQDTDTKYIPTKFALANYHMEAGEMKIDPQRHFVEAKTLYMDIFDLWKMIDPKPQQYPELLCNLGQVHWDLFEVEQDKEENGVAILQEASRFYKSSLAYVGRDRSTSSEVQQMIGIITSHRCELTDIDTELDQAIKDLSTVFKFDTSYAPSFLNDRQRWKSNPSHDITSHLASVIDRNPRTNRVRDLSLLALSQALLFRYNRRSTGDVFDLVRAEAIASSAIPLLSQENQQELIKVVATIKRIKKSRGIAPDLSGASVSKTDLFIEIASPLYYYGSRTPMTETTASSLTRIGSRNDPQSSASRTT